MQLLVKAKTNGFRRSGRAWSKDGTTVKASDFSDHQIELLKNDPDLIVVEVEDKAEAKAKADAKKAEDKAKADAKKAETQTSK